MASNLFILTGAGVSAESGLGVFRGPGGLWRNFRPEEVANINAWRRDPKLVWEFYSWRRERLREAKPNPAHYAIAELERRFGDRFFLCTQNVDDLHEQAGSRRITHIHGTLFESRCDSCARPPFAHMDCPAAGALPSCDACGHGTLRPNVVWFGEALPATALDATFAALERCDTFIAIGTSGVVEPVASFARQAKSQKARTIYIGPEHPANAEAFDEFMIGPASEQASKLVEMLDLP
jgi:NAD-dependent deacetylase